MSRAARIFNVALLFFAAACKTGDGAQLKDSSDLAASTDGSLIARLQAAGDEMARMPVVLPSEVWQQVSDAGGDADTTQILEKFLVHLFAGQDRRLVNSVMTSALGSQLGSVALLSNQAGPATPQEVAALSRAVFLIIKANPALLDTIAAVDPATLPPLQQAIFRRGNGSGQAAGVHPFMVPVADIPVVDMTNENCALPQPQFVPVANTRAGAIVSGRLLITAGVSPCFHENSSALAMQLNVLANNLLDGGGTPVDLRLAAGAEPVRVKTYEDLLVALQSAGYTFELFTTRVFVEFRAFVWKQGDNLSSVRMTTWMRAKSAGQPQPVPAEHGEVGLVIHKDGRRLAQVRWYAGLPDEAYPGQSAWWRPHPELAAPWAGVIHEMTEVYSPGSSVTSALDWFVAAAHGMRAYQAINVAYKPPHNSYGILVCTDSLAVHLAKLAGLRGASTRLTHTFPLVRGQFPVGSTDVTTLDSFFEANAQLPTGRLAAVYPADTLVARDGAKWRGRVAEAFPRDTVSAERYRHFPDFRSTLDSMIDQ